MILSNNVLFYYALEDVKLHSPKKEEIDEQKFILN